MVKLMRAIEAETFSGYGGLRQTEVPRPQATEDRVLVRVTAAGVTPLDHTILSGGHPRARAPLVLGNEGVGIIEDAGGSGLERVYPFAEAGEALRHLIEDRPFGKVVLAYPS